MTMLLSLETSTHFCSCALHQDQKLIALNESGEKQTAASQLAVMVDEMFIRFGFEKKHLDAVVVASGPGSYTGLRIGIATAKGICCALNIPLIAVNTLSLMVGQFIDQFQGMDLKDSLLCPMLDARRMEVYCTITDHLGQTVEPIQAKVIDENSFHDQLADKIIYFFGEGSEKCKGAIHHVNAKFVNNIKPSASHLGKAGYKKYVNNETENPNLLEPLYLKDFLIKKPKLIS